MSAQIWDAATELKERFAIPATVEEIARIIQRHTGNRMSRSMRKAKNHGHAQPTAT